MYVFANIKCLRYGTLRYDTWGWKTGITYHGKLALWITQMATDNIAVWD